MKKNSDDILKYLSGMMGKSEMKLFDEKLKTSEELKSLFQNAKEILSGLDLKNIHANETYFNNLVPRIRHKLVTGKKYSMRNKIYYLAPALSIVLLAIIFYPRSKNIPGTNYQELAEVVVNNLNDREVTDKYMSDYILAPTLSTPDDYSDFTLGLENTTDKIPDSYFELSVNSNAETIGLLNNMPEDELEELYAELSNINFQR